MERHALFFDIDGTLVSFKTHRIPDATLTALRQAKARGHRVYIATGRPMAIINNLGQMEDLIDGYVTTNGAYSFVGQEQVALNPVPKEAVDQILTDATVNDYSVIISGLNDYGVWNPKPMVRELFVDGLGVDASTLLLDAGTAAADTVLELTPFISAEQEQRLMATVTGCQSARWHPDFCDITSLKADKGQAIEAMARHEGFSLAHTMAFGDGGNDLSMIRRAGIGVAMGNALDVLKQAADYVTTSVDEGGIAVALEHFGLI